MELNKRHEGQEGRQEEHAGQEGRQEEHAGHGGRPQGERHPRPAQQPINYFVMIIDLILDRRDGQEYNPRQFYAEVMEYGGPSAYDITRAMDENNESATMFAICSYVILNGHPGEICDFIRSVKWL